jgi:hypothetical protein
MKTKSLILCAAILLAAPVLLFAQKTEVSVKKGKVIAETPTTSVAVEAGRKAVLSPNKNPTVGVDDPLVDAVMELYKWVEAEKQAQKEIIAATNILIIRIDEENRSKMAVLNEVPNTKSEQTNTHRIEDVPILGEPRFYDLQGHVLSFDFEQRNILRGDYVLHFPEPVKPRESFRYICASSLSGIVWLHEDPLWIMPMSAGRANCLAYYRVILPPSAIFVDSSRPVTIVHAFEGRVAVTVRNYTGPASDDGVSVAFLWPDKDGKTLADLPARYRGLRDEQEEKIVREGRRRTAEILAGGTYTGQKTPLETLLSLYSAGVSKNTAQFLELLGPNLRQFAAGQTDQVMRAAGLVVNFQFLGTPTWPDKPPNGYEHPVYLAREGSLICEATLVMVWENGKWYLQALEAGRTRDAAATRPSGPKATVSGGARALKAEPDTSEATYKGLPSAAFMRRWLCWGLSTFPGMETGNSRTRRLRRALTSIRSSLGSLGQRLTSTEETTRGPCSSQITASWTGPARSTDGT